MSCSGRKHQFPRNFLCWQAPGCIQVYSFKYMLQMEKVFILSICSFLKLSSIWLLLTIGPIIRIRLGVNFHTLCKPSCFIAIRKNTVQWRNGLAYKKSELIYLNRFQRIGFRSIFTTLHFHRNLRMRPISQCF